MVLAPVLSLAAQVTLAWDPNPESNLAGYTVYWGTASRSYDNQATIGMETSHPIEGLQEGKTYYIAVTAYDTEGNESGYSAELAYTVPVLDSDGDGVSDDNESNIYATDPQNPDTDRDQMDDGWEIDTGTDPLVDDAGGDLDGDGISNIDEYNGIVPPGNDIPSAPVLSYPLDGENEVSLTPVFQTGAFNLASIDAAHTRTQWQISRSADFTALVFDLLSDHYLGRLSLPDLILQSNQTYWWRARYFNDRSEVSDWSHTFEFMTVKTVNADMNADGVPDQQEVTQPGDLDQNGVPDQQQIDIKCVKSDLNQTLIGVKGDTPQTTVLALKSVRPESIAEDAGRPKDMTAGLICFKIAVQNAGATIDVGVHFDRSIPENATWYKYTLADGWHDYSSHIAFSPDRKSVVLTIKDGGYGDADGTANGIIVDPSGFGLSGSPATATDGDIGGGGCFIDSVAKRLP